MKDKQGFDVHKHDLVKVQVCGPGPGVPRDDNCVWVEGIVKHAGPYDLVITPTIDTDELAELYDRLGVDDPVELAELGEIIYESDPDGVALIQVSSLRLALDNFKDAAMRLSKVWEDYAPDDITGWMDFNEELLRILDMEIR